MTAGVRCGQVNPNRYQVCRLCGRRRPPRRVPKHKAVLSTMDYGAFIALNGGEHCGICGRGPSANRRLDRDHDHKTGEARGLLCWRDNSQLKGWMTVEWLEAAAAYLERTRGAA